MNKNLDEYMLIFFTDRERQVFDAIYYAVGDLGRIEKIERGHDNKNHRDTIQVTFEDGYAYWEMTDSLDDEPKSPQQVKVVICPPINEVEITVSLG